MELCRGGRKKKLILAVYCDRVGINCHSCPVFYQKRRGCLNEIPAYSLPGLGIDNAVLTWCPRKYTGGLTMLILGAYREYKSGFLPNPGGWLDQPMKFTGAMAVIDTAIARMEEQEAAKSGN